MQIPWNVLKIRLEKPRATFWVIYLFSYDIQFVEHTVHLPPPPVLL